tara:strand:+ start:8338 stop:8664 length:327 start_codon:yes stop_codon:yes gene_type:complete
MSLGHGEVTIELGDEVYELRPSLKAMKKIQARFGGLRGAMEALGQLNVETIACIVSAGANATPRELADIEEAVFSHGIANATEQVVPFITCLMNPNGDKETEDSTKKK